jgi:hypothetical protein
MNLGLVAGEMLAGVGDLDVAGRCLAGFEHDDGGHDLKILSTIFPLTCPVRLSSSAAAASVSP